MNTYQRSSSYTSLVFYLDWLFNFSERIFLSGSSGLIVSLFPCSPLNCLFSYLVEVVPYFFPVGFNG